MEEKPVVALMYDFDKTLSPRDMQEYAFIPCVDMEAADFWAECRRVRVEPADGAADQGGHLHTGRHAKPGNGRSGDRRSPAAGRSGLEGVGARTHRGLPAQLGAAEPG